MQKATVLLGWTRSVSEDISKVVVKINNDNVLSQVEVGPEVESIQITCKAQTTLIFSVVSIDVDGVSSESTVYNFTFGDLVTPVPAQNLHHEILSVFNDEE